MDNFLYGTVVTLCIVAALYFWKFRAQTRDRFFALFATAFMMLGLNYALLAFGDRESEFRPYLYVVRLLAFVLIILAIVDKNRGTDRSE